MCTEEDGKVQTIAFRILKRVSKRGEVSLASAIRVEQPRYKSHLDQYPLALLLEEGYLGMTLNYEPPAGAEEMREFCLANTLHMFTIPTNGAGETHYRGVAGGPSFAVFAKGGDSRTERRENSSYFFLYLGTAFFVR